MREQMTDAALASLGSKTTVAGVATSGVGWLASSTFFSYAGFLIALIGLLVNVYYRRKDTLLRVREDRRREIEHAALMRRLERDEQRAAHE